MVDEFTISIFEREVVLQLKALLSANEALSSATTDDQVWIALQNLLVAAANASKLLWGSGGRAATEREPLRSRLRVDDTSPLRDPDLRNDFEHCDERLKKQLEDPDWVTIYVGRNIGQGHAIPGVGGSREFQHFDPTTGRVSFWEHACLVPDLVAEAGRVMGTVDSSKDPAGAIYRSPRLYEATLDDNAQGGSPTTVHASLRVRLPPQPEAPQSG